MGLFSGRNRQAAEWNTQVAQSFPGEVFDRLLHQANSAVGSDVEGETFLKHIAVRTIASLYAMHAMFGQRSGATLTRKLSWKSFSARASAYCASSIFVVSMLDDTFDDWNLRRALTLSQLKYIVLSLIDLDEWQLELFAFYALYSQRHSERDWPPDGPHPSGLWDSHILCRIVAPTIKGLRPDLSNAIQLLLEGNTAMADGTLSSLSRLVSPLDGSMFGFEDWFAFPMLLRREMATVAQACSGLTAIDFLQQTIDWIDDSGSLMNRSRIQPA